VKLPEKYWTAEKTDLKFEIKAGENTADFALE
jgi:hypothetical protein